MKLYPDIKHLFDNINSTGRKPRYSPQQIAEQFVMYINDLSENVIEVETDYRRQTQNGNDKDGSKGGRVSQRRTMKYARPPKILDFVTRWLGMTHQWWYALPNGKRGKAYAQVIERIEQYVYDVKFDGAVVGIYNPSIIARDLGLKENINISKRDEDDNMTIEEVQAEIARLEKVQK